MNAIILEVSVFIILVVLALFFLNRLVRELDPENQGLWIIGFSLGTGVMAFGLKIAFIVVFGTYSEPMLAMLPKINPAPMSWDSGQPETFSFSGEPSAYQWQALPGSAPYPADNPPSLEKVELGKDLFFDKRLSLDGTLSCASCHELSQNKAGADGLSASIGIDQQQGNRNAPTVINAAFQQALFWDGRAASLEEQAKGPLVNPIEMGMPNLQLVVDRINAIDAYRSKFTQVFQREGEITIDEVAKAIASYERTLITPNSPYDRFVAGDKTALTPQQVKGMALFESIGCVNCHTGPNFSDASVFSEGFPYRIFPANENREYEAKYRFSEDRGLNNQIPGEDSLKGVWRIPSLRNVALTAPYFHNGSVETLNEAVRIMASVQLNKKHSNRKSDDESYNWSSDEKKMHITTNQAISDDEVDSLVAFLESLSGEIEQLN